MRSLLIAMGILVAVSCLPGCKLGPILQPTPPPIATPSPTATPPPTVPLPVLPMLNGTVTLRFSNLDQAPLTCRDDVQILATLTGEEVGIDRKQPIVELGLMGNSPTPCPVQPCNRGNKDIPCDIAPDLMGLRVRYTANIDHDKDVEGEQGHCGSGMNYHRRLALGPLPPGGKLEVTVSITDTQLIVATPVDSWSTTLKKPKSMSISRVVLGSPWTRREARAWGWDAFSAHNWARVDSIAWDVTKSGKALTCP